MNYWKLSRKKGNRKKFTTADLFNVNYYYIVYIGVYTKHFNQIIIIKNYLK